MKDKLSECSFVLSFEAIAQEAFKPICLREGESSDGSKVDSPVLIAAEESLLTLASYNDCTDGIFYCSVMRFEINDEYMLYVRFVHFHLLLLSTPLLKKMH